MPYSNYPFTNPNMPLNYDNYFMYPTMQNPNLGYYPYVGQGMYMMPYTNPMDYTDDIETYDEDMKNVKNDPPPVLSNNPVTNTIVLFKELTGYPNYGNPSGNADILYTGNRGTWTFDIPNAVLLFLQNFRARLIIRAVLDDHQNVATSRYSATIRANNAVLHTGALPLEHGTPRGGKFTNWRLLTFDVSNIRRRNQIVISNTSSAGPDDWIGFDWMELRFVR